MNALRSSIALGALFNFSFLAPAQNLSYSLLGSSAPVPSARVDGVIEYDPVSRQIFLFGGQDTLPRNDLWAYSLARRQWTEMQVSGPVPPARFGHTVVFDSARRRLVVFGGQASGFFSDVWAFDIAAGSWRQLSADNTGPSRRYGHSAIYETARDRMVISHGFTNAGRFDDTWAFDFSSNSWRDISPSGTRPLRRCLHHAAYDAERGEMYLYGGCSSGSGPCPQGDLWSLDLALNRWSERTPRSGPPAREHYGMAFNAIRGKLVIFGGSGAGLLNDTWEFDPRSGAWRQASVAGAAPGPRHRHQAAFAPDRGVIYYFGGSTSGGLTNELWLLGPGFLSGAPRIAQNGVVNAFSGSGGAIAPGEVVSIFGEGLGPIVGVAQQFDAQTGLLPTSGPGVTVTLNGIPSPLFYVHSEQVNIQVPYELDGASEAILSVTVNGQPSEAKTLTVRPVHPGLFPRVWNEYGAVNSPDNPAAPGSVIVLYATGQGKTNPPSRTGGYPTGVYPNPIADTVLLIGGVEAEILFRGQAPGTAGVMQVNAKVPETLARGVAVPIVLKVGGIESQAGVSLSIR